MLIQKWVNKYVELTGPINTGNGAVDLHAITKQHKRSPGQIKSLIELGRIPINKSEAISDLSNERKRSNDLIEDSDIINVRKRKYENQTRVYLMQQLDQAYNMVEKFTILGATNCFN